MPKLTKEQLVEVQEYIKTLPEEEREFQYKEIIAKLENEKPQCPFCLMTEGKIQTAKVFENSQVLAVLEINPANEGHILLFPKMHRLSISELNDNELESISKAIKSLSISLKSFSDSLNVLISEGSNSGNRFGHLVVNLIPRFPKDNVSFSWKGNQTEDEQLKKIKDKIIENIPKEKKVEEPMKPIDPNDIKARLKRKVLP